MVPAAPGRLCLAGGTVVLSALLLQGCIPKPPPPCSTEVENCIKTGCCTDKSLTCYARDAAWASCKSSCSTSFGHACEKVGKGGKVTFRTTTQAPVVEEPVAAHVDDFKWIEGTWTTGYWDCCKPSCSWPGKGKLDNPVRSCDAKTGQHTSANDKSVCDKGTSVTCADNQPFKVTEDLSMGFVAAAVSGHHGLKGDANCGQCFEIIFTNRQHIDKATGDKWGGSHPDLVNKRMIVQISNIGFDVKGNHSFDLLIPGAGLGIFTKGCKAQYPKKKTDDFDCGNRHGGCDTKEGCKDLPKELQKGCEWRYDWYQWLKKGGRSNNPYIKFRRVQCPSEIVAISGATPNDDFDFPEYAKKLIFS